ncbi:MFS transporter [Thalassospira marina]|uniref:MFS transporter n=1 Tax=Thalassospira marina TaxID=2048283 RepID=A0A2N3KYT0_9PROT|nr:MFS transporter [Thalassospira marina]PKR55650.1 MFS transporter [Thalassospira marina]
MLAHFLSHRLDRRNIHYGWVMAAVTFLTMLGTAGAVGAPGVFIVPLEKQFGWDAAEISSALAIRFALFGMIGPFAAAFMNRFGVRKVVMASLLIVLCGLLSSLAMTQLWQLVLLWGVVVGLGTGLTAIVLGATVATRWFHARRGLVIGLLTASSATGQLVFLPILARVTDQYGWQAALALICSFLAFVAFCVWLLMHNHPADVNLPAYGADDVTPLPTQNSSLGQLMLSPITILREAARTRAFWILFISFFICGASTNGLIQTHFIALCGDYSIAAVAAASMLAMMGIFDFFGTIGSGWLSDRFDSRKLLFTYYGLRGLSLVYLPFSDFTLYSLSIFAIFYGLDWIATVPPTVKLVAQNFGGIKTNVVFGWIFAGHQLGAASAAFGGGLARTTYNSYLPAFFTAGILCIAAALMILLMKEAASETTPPKLATANS